MDKLVSRIDKWVRESHSRFKKYKKKLLFPYYLFPVKIFTYTVYYAIKSTFKLSFSLIKIILETIAYPFRGLKNLIKSGFILALVIYVATSLFVIVDYINKEYGHYGKFLCSYGTNK